MQTSASSIKTVEFCVFFDISSFGLVNDLIISSYLKRERKTKEEEILYINILLYKY